MTVTVEHGVFIVRHGRTFDLTAVLDAVDWAYNRAQREDEMNAAKNTAENVQWSPLTRQLEKAYADLLEIQMTMHRPESQDA